MLAHPLQSFQQRNLSICAVQQSNNTCIIHLGGKWLPCTLFQYQIFVYQSSPSIYQTWVILGGIYQRTSFHQNEQGSLMNVNNAISFLYRLHTGNISSHVEPCSRKGHESLRCLLAWQPINRFSAVSKSYFSISSLHKHPGTSFPHLLRHQHSAYFDEPYQA